MKNGLAWFIICLLSLLTACLLAYPIFPVPEMVGIMLLASLSLLTSFQQTRQPRFAFYCQQIFLVGLIIAGYYSPALWAGLPLIVCNLDQLPDYYSLILTLALPFLRPQLLLQIMAVYMAMSIAIFLARLTKHYQELKAQYFQTLDSMTSDKMRLESARHRMVTENELARENDILAERNRIAREIHDNVGHQLTAAILQTAALELAAQGETKADLGKLKENLEHALEEVRASVHNLHAESLSIDQALHNLEQNYHFCPVFIKTELSQEPDAATHHAVLAICREALANTAKHSNASRVDISLRNDHKSYHLLIVDNGSQQASPVSPQPGGGIGLYNMEDRVNQLGGQINISQEWGFRIFIRLPLDGKAVPEDKG